MISRFGIVYPTRRAILLVAAGAPLSLVAAAAAVNLWLAGIAWLVLALGLIAVDIVFSPWAAGLRLGVELPSAIPLAKGADASVQIRFASPATRHTGVAVATNSLLRTEARVDGSMSPDRIEGARFHLHPSRRGMGRVERIWVRWPGPLGLTWKQHVEPLNREVPIVTNIGNIKDEALKLLQRNRLAGSNVQRELGDGAEFHALRDFRAGMDRRTIAWKQSAKHSELLAKEFQAESNQQIILVLDSGRLMCEPLGIQPRLDCALDAALLLAYAALKQGDRVALFAFDSRPRFLSGTVSGSQGFAALQHLAARIDYSNDETNYTLGLTWLCGELRRRSLIVVFTEFIDTTSAELMVENVERLLRSHIVVFVAFYDEELYVLKTGEPRDGLDIARAVIADAVLRERDIVIARLRRLGVQIVEAPVNRIGNDLLNTYFDLKRRNAI